VRHEEERVFSLILSSPSPKSTKKTRIFRQNARSKMENNEKVVFLSKSLSQNVRREKSQKQVYMYFWSATGSKSTHPQPPTPFQNPFYCIILWIIIVA
jgi:hypothetical protein